MSDPFIIINGRRIGPGYPVYIVAELSANSGQNLYRAEESIRMAGKAGADAVKLQMFTADTLTIDCTSAPFKVDVGLWAGRILYDLYKETYTPWEWYPRLKEVAQEVGVDLFSTAFDESAVDFLEKMDVPIHKIGSFELVDLPLIRRMAKTGKPLIISTGMGSREEIQEAVDTAFKGGIVELALLKCTSAYPAPDEEMNLRTIQDLEESFGIPVGLSDHSMGKDAAMVAVGLGACIIEKHFTISREHPTADAAFSMEPAEFKDMVRSIRRVESMLGSVVYQPVQMEQKNVRFRKSLFVVKDVKAGESFTTENVRSIRPGGGLHTRYLDRVLNCKAAKDIERGTPLTWEHCSGG